MKLRPMTVDELDEAGMSAPQDCRICRSGLHHCGGCDNEIDHESGSTCDMCWKIIMEAQA